jgi:hypothetical protein
MPKFEKGSQEAKDYMKSLRDKRKMTGGALEKPPMRILPQPINRRPTKKPEQSQSDTVNAIKMHMGEIEKELNNLRGMEGEGIISDITDKVKNVADKTTNYVTKAVESVKTAIKGRNDYPPAVRKILRTYGDKKIISAIINRKPVDGKLTSLLNVLSLGQFKKNIASQPYDDLFHLSIVLRTEDGVDIQIEKTEVIKMGLRPRKGGEMLNVTPFTGGKTLNEIMDNTQEKMGDNFFSYSARNNNCQDFITALLKSNGMGDTNDFTFVKQDANQMFKGLGTLSKVADYITDLGGKVDVIMKGKGARASRISPTEPEPEPEPKPRERLKPRPRPRPRLTKEQIQIERLTRQYEESAENETSQADAKEERLRKDLERVERTPELQGAYRDWAGVSDRQVEKREEKIREHRELAEKYAGLAVLRRNTMIPDEVIRDVMFPYLGKLI